MKFAVIKTGGKQYVVSENDVITVDHIDQEPEAVIEFETLASGDYEKDSIELGKPFLTKKVTGTVIENMKGDKLRVARYKSKTRNRKVRGFRAMLTKIKISTL